MKPFISLMKPSNSFLKPVQLQLKSPRPLFWASFAFASLQALQASAFECHREPASRWLRSWASQLFTWPADLDRGGLVDFAWLPGAPFQTLCPAAATGLEIFQGRPGPTVVGATSAGLAAEAAHAGHAGGENHEVKS